MLPAAQPPQLCRLSTASITGTCRLVGLAAEHPGWEPDNHRRFPRAFRQATRTVLLIVCRQRGGDSSCDSRLGWASAKANVSSLPVELLHSILALAAYPLSDWILV